MSERILSYDAESELFGSPSSSAYAHELAPGNRIGSGRAGSASNPVMHSGNREIRCRCGKHHRWANKATHECACGTWHARIMSN